jgi:hypothetical protein
MTNIEKVLDHLYEERWQIIQMNDDDLQASLEDIDKKILEAEAIAAKESSEDDLPF